MGSSNFAIAEKAICNTINRNVKAKFWLCLFECFVLHIYVIRRFFNFPKIKTSTCFKLDWWRMIVFVYLCVYAYMVSLYNAFLHLHLIVSLIKLISAFPYFTLHSQKNFNMHHCYRTTCKVRMHKSGLTSGLTLDLV